MKLFCGVVIIYFANIGLVCADVKTITSTSAISIDMVLPYKLIPKDFASIYFGLPVKEFIETHKRVKPEDHLASLVAKYMDPEEAERQEQQKTQYVYTYKEKIKSPVFGTAEYGFDVNMKLDRFAFYYVSISAGRIIKHRRIVLKELVRLWGPPTKKQVFREIGSMLKKPFWEAHLYWNFKNGQAKFLCPQNVDWDWTRAKDPLLFTLGYGLGLRLSIMSVENAKKSEQYLKTGPWKKWTFDADDPSLDAKEIRQVFKDIELDKIIEEVKAEKSGRK